MLIVCDSTESAVAATTTEQLLLAEVKALKETVTQHSVSLSEHSVSLSELSYSTFLNTGVQILKFAYKGPRKPRTPNHLQS
jgi:hypothetical protein